jgi:NAD+ synthase
VTRAAESRGAASKGPDLQLNNALVEQVLCGFLLEETRRTGREKLVVGLSGGIDSAVAAALAARALGPENVHGLLMPYRASSPSSLKDGKTVGRQLGISQEIIDITPMIDAFFVGAPAAGRRRRGNRMARERMAILYDRSESLRALVLGTSNKTELLLGYGTLFGDMSSALNPLGDLYKTQVRQLADYLKLPISVRRKLPSADLWEGQSDEEEIGAPYPVVDAILHLLVDERLTVDEVASTGFDLKFVRKLWKSVAATQFKRRPPLIAKISARTVGIDFRYPRDWGT